MAEHEAIEIRKPGRKTPARVTRETKERLRGLAEAPYEDTVEVKGEVCEADVRRQRFQLTTAEQKIVTVSFTVAQEDQVTTALKDHRSVQLVVSGRGEFPVPANY